MTRDQPLPLEPNRSDTLSRSDEQRWPTISVIIPVRNGETTIGEQLAALASQDYKGDWELIVADNGSSDQTLEIVRRWSEKIPHVRIVDASERAGINHARNAGSFAAHGEFLLFCDADDVAAPEWVAWMARAARNADLVGGHLEQETLNRYPTTSWKPSPTKDGLPTALGFLPYAVGCNLGIRASVLREIGGWNEEYAGGGDEVDLCWRAQLKHFRLRYEPRAVIHYRLREGLWALARQRYRYGIGTIRLYRDFREYGIPQKRVLIRARTWMLMLVQAPPFLLSDRKRGVWVRKVAYRLGLFVGNFRLRRRLL